MLNIGKFKKSKETINGEKLHQSAPSQLPNLQDEVYAFCMGITPVSFNSHVHTELYATIF